jgi:uncharacterized protein (TIGR02118 family)
MKKVIVAVRGPLDDTVPDAPGLVAYSVHRNHPDEPTPDPGATPENLGGVAMAWFADDAQPDPASWFDVPVEAYLVDERIQIDWTRDWPDGTPTPAIEQVPFVRKVDKLTRDEFATHWSEKHTLLVPVHHPGVARYVQNVVIEPLTPDAPEFDGVAQLYFRTAHDYHERYYDSPEGQKIIFEDVARFLDRGNGWRMLAQETWLKS